MLLLHVKHLVSFGLDLMNCLRFRGYICIEVLVLDDVRGFNCVDEYSRGVLVRTESGAYLVIKKGHVSECAELRSLSSLLVLLKA